MVMELVTLTMATKFDDFICEMKVNSTWKLLPKRSLSVYTNSIYTNSI